MAFPIEASARLVPSGLAAISAVVLAAGLTVSRAADAAQPAAPKAEGRAAILVPLIETIVGPGAARLAVADGRGGGRSVLVQLDAGSRQGSEQQVRAVLAGAGFSEKDGDQITVQRFQFAAGARGSGTTIAWLEVAALALLTVLTGWLALFRRAGEAPESAVDAAPEPAPQAAEVSAVDIMAGDPRRRELAAAAEVAVQDPAAVASVIRAWIKPAGGRAA